MKYLLDTHTFLWWISDIPRLSSRVHQIISNGQNVLYLSAASAWEIVIKSQTGKLQLPDNPERFISEQLSLNTIRSLPIVMSHALHYHRLPALHRDPFDRMLVAQAQIEKLPLLSADQQIAHYDVKVIW